MMATMSALMLHPSWLARLCHGGLFAARRKLRHKSAKDQQMPIEIRPLPGLPELKPGDDLADAIVRAARAQDVGVREDDIFVVAQKIVSKAEGRIVRLESVTPSKQAFAWAQKWNKDARVVELVLREAQRFIRMERGIIIAQTRHGFVCANAGVDVSNAEAGTAILLPENPDRSAHVLQSRLALAFACHVGVIVSDTFGRAWREGLVNVALGVAGLSPLLDYRGRLDANGKPLQATVIALADELAAAAELVMGKADRIPVALIRGVKLAARSGTGADLIRAADKDLFR
jgi:coenzyme F420-0:L-glutamate ligase/coenzyme F420-1:gamma-L-glutamate ligase